MIEEPQNDLYETELELAVKPEPIEVAINSIEEAIKLPEGLYRSKQTGILIRREGNTLTIGETPWERHKIQTYPAEEKDFQLP